MDQDRTTNKPGINTGNRSGSSGWSPATQPGPASGPGSVTNTAGQGSGGNPSKDHEGLRSTARELRDKAMEQGSEVMENVQSRVSGAVDQGKNRLAGQIDSVSDAVDEVADKLDDQTIGRYAHMGADQLHHLADYLRDADPAEMARGIQSYARRRPDLFLGGALIAGLLLGRFLRAHEPREERLPEGRRDEDFSYGRDFEHEESLVGAAASNVGPNIGAGPGIGAASTGIGYRGQGSTGSTSYGSSGVSGLGSSGSSGTSGLGGSPGLGSSGAGSSGSISGEKNIKAGPLGKDASRRDDDKPTCNF